MAKRNSYLYQALEPHATSHGNAVRKKWLFGSGIVSLLCAWAISLAIVYQLRPGTVTYTYNDTDDRTYECGSTVDEAVAAGCRFDPVSFAWLPERCLDRELAADLVANTSWTLHSDPAGKSEKSDMDFGWNQTTTYITNGNHILHCLYSWRRLHRLILAGKPYHSGLSYGHTEHCTTTILDAIQHPPDEIRTEALVIVPAC